MLKTKVFGNGAAGNKAVIKAIESSVIGTQDIMLINSTDKDIPAEYTQSSVIIGDGLNGAGKEMEVGKMMMESSLNGGEMERMLPVFLTEDTDAVAIVGSSEGGTGCGSMIELGSYILENVGIPVHLFIFTGFEDDGRGLENTIKLFNNMPKSFTVHIISNAKFINLDSVRGNKMKAEAEANIEFCNRLKIMIGKTMIDSVQNIDDTDLNKLVNTSGYTLEETIVIPKEIKNTEQINTLIDEAFNSSKSLETDRSCKRLGVIISATQGILDAIDYSFKRIKEHVGEPFEVFQHIQTSENASTISIISSGMKLPKDEINGIYDRYQQKFNSVDKEEDSFYAQNMETSGGSMFDSALTNNKKKNFFKNNTTKNVSPTLKNESTGVIQKEV